MESTINIASNPWSFKQSDIVSATATASPNGLVMNAEGTVVVLTTTAAHGLSAGWYVTVLGDSGTAAYQGCYKVLSVPTTTTADLEPIGGAVTQATSILSGGGGNTVVRCLYPWQARIEDIQWEKPAAGESLDLRDANGNILWQGSFPTGATAPNWNRGKLFWVQGFSPVSISAGGTGIVIATIN